MTTKEKAAHTPGLIVCCGPDGLHCADKQVQRTPLTDELLQSISRRNGYLSPEQVYATMLAGKPVYTNFSRYWIEES